MSRAILGSAPKRDSSPERSRRTVSGAVSSIRGENDCAHRAGQHVLPFPAGGANSQHKFCAGPHLNFWSCRARRRRAALFHLPRLPLQRGFPSRTATACDRKLRLSAQHRFHGKIGNEDAGERHGRKQFSAFGSQFAVGGTVESKIVNRRGSRRMFRRDRSEKLRNRVCDLCGSSPRSLRFTRYSATTRIPRCSCFESGSDRLRRLAF